ncbi:hypothetical protein FOZ62_005520 [Perkinsus olseni]|uniref:Uncharacterized protein n=1 Tax=Perkinsus olseni TaxID=32597 RepID=A0A7J6QXD1_PEROL|nr:hypothetical protein FOZ62_005520 [Perkinsus olseni]
MGALEETSNNDSGGQLALTDMPRSPQSNDDASPKMSLKEKAQHARRKPLRRLLSEQVCSDARQKKSELASKLTALTSSDEDSDSSSERLKDRSEEGSESSEEGPAIRQPSSTFLVSGAEPEWSSVPPPPPPPRPPLRSSVEVAVEMDKPPLEVPPLSEDHTRGWEVGGDTCSMKVHQVGRGGRGRWGRYERCRGRARFYPSHGGGRLLRRLAIN